MLTQKESLQWKKSIFLGKSASLSDAGDYWSDDYLYGYTYVQNSYLSLFPEETRLEKHLLMYHVAFIH